MVTKKGFRNYVPFWEETKLIFTNKMLKTLSCTMCNIASILLRQTNYQQHVINMMSINKKKIKLKMYNQGRLPFVSISQECVLTDPIRHDKFLIHKVGQLF